MVFTEFDEQAISKYWAIRNLTDKYSEFLNDDETMGVVQGYEDAARKIGVSEDEINACYSQ